MQSEQPSPGPASSHLTPDPAVGQDARLSSSVPIGAAEIVRSDPDGLAYDVHVPSARRR